MSGALYVLPKHQFLQKLKKIFQILNFYFMNKIKIKFWTTIVIYKDGKEIAKEIGLDNKEDIYNLLKKGI